MLSHDENEAPTEDDAAANFQRNIINMRKTNCFENVDEKAMQH